MTGKNIEEGFKALGGELRGFYSRNKTHIFTALSIGGTIATCVSSARSGARIARRIDREERELGRRLTAKEKIKMNWKDMLLPAGLCLGSITCSFSTDRIATDMIARSNAALIVSEQAYEQLSRRTKEVLGEKKAKQIQDEIVKEKVEKVTDANGRPMLICKGTYDDAPRVGSGTLTPFLDQYSGLPFWSNIDYIDKNIMEMREIMRDLAPRGGHDDYSDKTVGVSYREWLHRIGYRNAIADTPERRNKGWNKGFAKDGSEDDEIDYVRTTMEYEPGFPVCVINWTKDPVDMKLGYLLKGSGI